MDRALIRTLELDAARWISISDFYDSLLAALGAPHWHGYNANALVDSMIYGGINEISPPYFIRIIHMAELSEPLRAAVATEVGYVLSARNSDNMPNSGSESIDFEMIE